jgi:type VI secretion system protein ImpA
MSLPLESLMEPIDTTERTGSDPRLVDPKQRYQQVKDARTTARRLERETLFDTETNGIINEYWRKVSELSLALLTEQAKDIEVAAWLTEALVRLEGFSGLADGFAIMRQLIENYWPAIYPMEDEEGLPGKLAALAGLNGASSPGALIDPIYWIPITQTPQAFNTWHYQQALQAGQQTDESSEEVITLKILEDAAKQSGPVFMQQLKTGLERCLTEYKSLCQLVDTLCGVENAPPSSHLRNALLACQVAVTQLSKDLLPAETILETTDKPSDNGEMATNPIPSTISSRQHAFASLLKLADYFRQQEPNSPVSYLLEQAVRWGNMPLPQLLAELVSDPQSLRQSYQLIGVRPMSDSN